MFRPLEVCVCVERGDAMRSIHLSGPSCPTCTGAAQLAPWLIVDAGDVLYSVRDPPKHIDELAHTMTNIATASWQTAEFPAKVDQMSSAREASIPRYTSEL